MIVTDKGISLDVSALSRAINYRQGTFDIAAAMDAITVNPEIEEEREEDCAYIDTADSSMIVYAIYNPNALRLVVRFHNGGTYAYEGVTIQQAFAFAQAPSKGTFFHQNIKGKLVARKVSR